jgi:hypothetical protein
MTTIARGAMPRVEGASERLRRDDDAGLTGYDDLAAPSWDAFLRSRRRFLNGEAVAASVPSAPADPHFGRRAATGTRRPRP